MCSRPMSSIVKPEEGKIYFLSDQRTAKDDEIAARPEVLLAYGNGASQFVSTRAHAVLSSDRALIKRLWNPGAQAFWPAVAPPVLPPEPMATMATTATTAMAPTPTGTAASCSLFRSQ